jgi:hypothetical protein
MTSTGDLSPAVEVEVTTHGQFSGAAEYARSRVAHICRLAHRPVLRARVKLTRSHDSARLHPVVAQANLAVGNRQIRAQAEGANAREAIDGMVGRLRDQFEHAAKHWEHGQSPRRYGSAASQGPTPVLRPADERKIARRKSFAMAPCTIDEAAQEMELLDYDFHLFTEKQTGMACVLYRGGPTGYRLALVAPATEDQLAPFELPLTISPHTAPCMTVEQACERLALLGVPFLFFVDAVQGRASVLYVRYDRHFGLITPAG